MNDVLFTTVGLTVTALATWAILSLVEYMTLAKMWGP